MIVAAILSLVITSAHAQMVQRYVVVCTAPCTAPDGTIQPAGTVLNRIVAAPTFNAGAGLSLVPDTGQVIYTPAPVVTVPTTISPYDFMARLTAAEQAAITTASQSNATVMLFLLKLAAVDAVTVADPVFQSGLSAMVSAGLLTQARATQIANLGVASP